MNKNIFVGGVKVENVGLFFDNNDVWVNREMVEEKFSGNGIYELKLGRVDCGIFGIRRGLKDVVKREKIGEKKNSIFVEVREIV
jgi:hypothetical protein